MSFRARQGLFIAFAIGVLVLAGWYGSSTVLAAVAALAVAPYWLGPALIWLTNRSRVPDWEPVTEGGVDSLPPQHLEFFEGTEQGLGACGFVKAAAAKQSGLVPGFETWVVVFVSVAHDERAVVVANVVTDPNIPIRPKPMFYFRTRFTDGRTVETSNVQELSVFPQVAGADSRRFPEIGDVCVLERLHRIRLAPIGSAPLETIPEGRALDHLTRGMAEFYELHCGTGYLRVVEPGRSYRPTIKGALLMAWKLLPPMSWIARNRVKRENQAFLAVHGITP